jgi:hypothetical protein
MIRDPVCVYMIIDMCSKDDPEVKMYAAVTIANLCHKDESAQAIFGESNAIPGWVRVRVTFELRVRFRVLELYVVTVSYISNHILTLTLTLTLTLYLVLLNMCGADIVDLLEAATSALGKENKFVLLLVYKSPIIS